MPQLGRARSRLTRILLCIGLCTSVVAEVRAAEDPSLQLYLDFESYEPDLARRTWILHDRSKNGFDVEFDNPDRGVALTPTRFGHALATSADTIGTVRTNGIRIYRPGDGLTVAVWARFDRYGLVEPFMLDGILHDDPPFLLSIWQSGIPLRLNTISLTWEAYQQDERTWVFGCRFIRSVMPRGEWIHCASVYDPNAERAFLYLNGEEVAAAATNGAPFSSWAESTVRMRLEPGDTTEPVYVDEVRFYNRALSADEVHTIMWQEHPLSVSSHETITVSWGEIKRR